LRLPGEAPFLPLLIEVTKKMAEAAGFDDGTAGRVGLAVDEAAASLIERAYGGAPGHEVEARFEDRAGEFRVDLLDDGAGVVSPQGGRRGSPGENRALELKVRIMDSVAFGRQGRRSACSLVKRKPQPPPGR
jgi:anti-sigma regulatory factor (Ser/Thr protein kinase)